MVVVGGAQTGLGGLGLVRSTAFSSDPAPVINPWLIHGRLPSTLYDGLVAKKMCTGGPDSPRSSRTSYVLVRIRRRMECYVHVRPHRSDSGPYKVLRY